VAIAVALANGPQVLFADEPTGELDSATGEEVFAALRSANVDLGATVVIVTHDSEVSRQVQRTVAIRDGRNLVRGRSAHRSQRRRPVGDDRPKSTRSSIAAGRLQLPSDFRRTLGLKDRVRLELEPRSCWHLAG